MVADPFRPPMRRVRPICWILLMGGLLALWPLQREIDAQRGVYAPVADVLYVPSGKFLRRTCLGYEGLLADIYWTRVVQYYGRRRMAQERRYELLGPLLRITTELDPHLVIAYRFGSIFLAEKAPDGAGEPREALALLSRGIAANPEHWRLWEDLGFIYYWDLKDYATAARVFRAGSERPGALVWMKVLAATVASRGGEISTSRLLWSEIYRNADNNTIRRSAQQHLLALDAQEQMGKLNEILVLYQKKTGRWAGAFQELVAAGVLGRIPLDPSGVPYIIAPDGKVTLNANTKVDARLLQ